MNMGAAGGPSGGDPGLWRGEQFCRGRLILMEKAERDRRGGRGVARRGGRFPVAGQWPAADCGALLFFFWPIEIRLRVTIGTPI